MTSVVKKLEQLLAESYLLYLKTQNYHWNIEGANFRSLHLLFEEQYTELATAIDTAAELIRALGAKAPGTFEEFMKHTSIKSGNKNATAEQMLTELIEDHSTIQKTLRETILTAQKAGDEVVAGFATERLTVHSKALWMLKSSL